MILKKFLRIQNIYQDCYQSNLSEINKYFIKEISKILTINANFQDSINFKKIFQMLQKDYLKSVKPQMLLFSKWIKSKNYLNLIFLKNNIKIEWFEYNKTNTFKEKNNKTFNQNLSIIDYIFNFE